MQSHLALPSKSFEEIAHHDFQRLRTQIEGIALDHKTLLISGGTGFFGAWLLGLCAWIDRYREPSRFHVIAVSRDPAQFLKRHPWAASLRWLEWITGDIRAFEYPTRDIDWVIHAAADTSAEAGRAPAVLLDTVVAGVQRMLDCAKRCHAQRILLVSSGAVYGAQPANISHRIEDTSAACNPLLTSSSYGEAKRVMELLGAIHAEVTKAAVMSARCFAFVGPGLPLNGHFAIGNFIRDALHRSQLTVRGDGLSTRSYLYAADLAVWLMRILAKGESQRAYNVGSDQDLSIADLAHRVAEALAPSKPVVIEKTLEPSPVGNRYVPSISRARSELGLEVWTPLKQGVISTACWGQQFL